MESKSSADEHQQLLQLKYKTYQLEQENKALKQKLHIADREEDHHRSAPDAPKTVDKSFGEQIAVSDDHYKIPIAIRNKLMDKFVVGVMSGGADESGRVKSVANFQINPEQNQNVLQQPMPMNSKSTTTTTTPTSVVKKENLATPKVQSTSTRTVPKAKPLPKGKLRVKTLTM